MAFKALKSFAGVVSMRKGEIAEIKDLELAKKLMSENYIEEIESEKKPAKKEKSAKDKERSNAE